MVHYSSISAKNGDEIHLSIDIYNSTFLKITSSMIDVSLLAEKKTFFLSLTFSDCKSIFLMTVLCQSMG